MEYYKFLRQYVGTKPLILPGSVVIIGNGKGEVLLQKRPEGRWGLPGGLMELGESFEEVAKKLASKFETYASCTSFQEKNFTLKPQTATNFTASLLSFTPRNMKEPFNSNHPKPSKSAFSLWIICRRIWWGVMGGLWEC